MTERERERERVKVTERELPPILTPSLSLYLSLPHFLSLPLPFSLPPFLLLLSRCQHSVQSCSPRALKRFTLFAAASSGGPLPHSIMYPKTVK